MKQADALPACYAMVQPGLEEIAAEEIRADLGGKIKKTGQGFIVFRVSEIDRDLLHLLTCEDILLLAWGTDELSYRAKDLESIRHWTAKTVDWAKMLALHHAIRPKPKGKPTYRLVVQMSGQHGYRRVDALKALAQGLTGKFPASWRPAEENASIEIWLTIHAAAAVCGLRLSDRLMRHRDYKLEHLPASLRPSVAAAMAHLADLKPGHIVLDPMCGAGTLLAESHLWARKHLRGAPGEAVEIWGGDIDPHHVRFAETNLRRFDNIHLDTWDARRLPIEPGCVDRILCNPPFGKQLATPEEIGPLYRLLVRQMDRVLKPKGKAVLLVMDDKALCQAAEAVGWKRLRQVNPRILGQRASIFVFQKGEARKQAERRNAEGKKMGGKKMGE